MNIPHPDCPATFGLFEKRFEGDDALMELARLRFQQAGMGAEMHGGTPEALDWTLRFQPVASEPVFVHLSRELNLAQPQDRERIADLAMGFVGQVRGFVLHDHPEMASRPEAFREAARELDSRLERSRHRPMIYIEYAAGLESGDFVAFFESIRELPHISVCIDTGHVGIRQAQNVYAAIHPGEDVCGLKARLAKLHPVIGEIQNAARSALPMVLSLIQSLGALGKPIHFHLHDGHPLSTFSPFGVSDHLSFLAEIPLPFEYEGRRALPLMFGPAGLSQIIAEALGLIGPERATFTLEIHPAAGRVPLGDAAPLFAHWRDKTHPEQMNHWLSVLAENHVLLAEAVNAAQPGAPRKPVPQDSVPAGPPRRASIKARASTG